MNGVRIPLAAQDESLYNGAMPTRSTRRPARRAARASKPSRAAALKSHQYLTTAEGQRRAIILDMNYYLKLLGEVHTLRALVKQRSPAAAPSRGRRRTAR